MSHTSAHADDLGAVLKLEQELASRLAAARVEAERLLTEARDEVAHREQRLEEELARQTRELDARLLIEREQRLAAMAEAARRRLARWEQIDDVTVDRAAGVVVDALIAGPRGGRR